MIVYMFVLDLLDFSKVLFSPSKYYSISALQALSPKYLEPQLSIPHPYPFLTNHPLPVLTHITCFKKNAVCREVGSNDKDQKGEV